MAAKSGKIKNIKVTVDAAQVETGGLELDFTPIEELGQWFLF